MKLSVIVTTYNRPKALSKVLSGLAHQTRPADEVIVADDGSRDDTRACIEALRPTLPCPLVYVWHPDEGFRAAKIRNDAIRRAEGDYIVLLDGDCVPNRYFVKDHLALARQGAFLQGKRVLVEKKVADRFDWHEANAMVSLFRYLFRGGLSNAHHIIRCAWLPAFAAPGISGTRSCNMGLFKTDLLAVNGFNEDFIGWGREDSELAVRLYNMGLKRRTHPFMAICYHLWHMENDRSKLEQNDTILQATMKSGVVSCANGIRKTRSSHEVAP